MMTTARAGFDRDVDGPWQRSLRTRQEREPQPSAPLRGPGTVEAAMMAQRSRDVAASFAALASDQELRASQLQHELDMLRGRRTDATGRDPVLPSGAVDVGRFLSSIPTFQPELADMESYLQGHGTKIHESPVRRVAVEPTVSPAVNHAPEEAQALREAEDWRTKAQALLHAADSASAAATALTSTAEAIAATLPRAPSQTSPVKRPGPDPNLTYDPRQYVPDPVELTKSPGPSEPAYDPRQDVFDPAEVTTAAAAMMAGPTDPPPARPGTSHGRGRRPDATAPPMIAADEYDEELHRIAHYEKTRGSITSTTAPVADQLPGLAWHGEDNQDEDAAFTMVSPAESETDEDEDKLTAEFYSNSKTVSFAQPATGETNNKPPALSVPAATDHSDEEEAQSDSEIANDEPGLGQVSPGTPPAAVVQAWRDEDDSLLPPAAVSGSDAPAVAPIVAKVGSSPSRSQRSNFRAVDTENGHAAVLSSLKTLGVSTQVHAVIASTDNVLDELSSLRKEVKTLKQRLASERRARVESAARETLLRQRLHAVQGALPPIAADVDEVTRFYARVAPGYVASDKPAKVVKFFHRKAQKEDRGNEWRQYMCENLAERWGQSAFDLLQNLAKRIAVDEPSFKSQAYKAVKARSEASERTRMLAQPRTRHKRSKAQNVDKAEAQGKPRKDVGAGSGNGSGATHGALPAKTRRPFGAAASTKIPTGTTRSQMRGQRKAADRAAAVGRVGKPPPEELFFGGFGATNAQVSMEAGSVFEYRAPTEARAAVTVAKEAADRCSAASLLEQTQNHFAEARTQLDKAETHQQRSTMTSESPFRGWDGTPHRSSAVKAVDMARAEAEAALDNYVEAQRVGSETRPAGPQHAQFAELVGGTWRYPGRQMMERLQLERGDADRGVGSALLGGAEPSVDSNSAAASVAELPLDAPQQEGRGSESKIETEQASMTEQKNLPEPEPEPEPEPKPEHAFASAPHPIGASDVVVASVDNGLEGALGDLMGALRQDPNAVLNHPGVEWQTIPAGLFPNTSQEGASGDEVPGTPSKGPNQRQSEDGTDVPQVPAAEITEKDSRIVEM